MRDVIIAGGGPAGISALIWCSRLGLDAVLLERSGQLGGQLARVYNAIIDYPGLWAENGRELQEKLTQHVNQLGCSVQYDSEIERIQLADKRVITKHGEYQAKMLILCTGANDRRLGVPGEKEMIERGELYSVARDKSRFAGKQVAVIGGGDRAFEGALLLAEHGAAVTLVHRSKEFRARMEFVQLAKKHPQIQIITNTMVMRIHDNTRVQSIELYSAEAGKKWTLPAHAVFVRIGIQPANYLIREQVKTDEDGYIIVDDFGETSVSGVFAGGDLCTRPLFSSITSSVYQGMRAARSISYRINNKE